MRFVRHSGFLCLSVLWSVLALAQTTAVVARNARLRSTPSNALTPIRFLVPNEALTLVTTAQVNGYYHVRTAQNEEGWVYRTFIKLRGTPPPLPAATCGPGTEIVVHPSCPAVGKHSQNHQLVAYAANSDGGLRNLAKRHVPDSRCTPKAMTLDDVRSLQNYINNTFGDARMIETKFEPTRVLTNIPTFDGTRNEGDLVALSAYLTLARDEGSESVNCAAADGIDIHINLGPKSAHPVEYDGIVAEMIPQLPRPTGWNSITLNRLASRQVLVIGGLTYDNEHYVNDNPASPPPKPNQPKRFSLWEIHPITAFYVCPAGDGCDPAQLGQWVTLTAWATAHP